MKLFKTYQDDSINEASKLSWEELKEHFQCQDYTIHDRIRLWVIAEYNLKFLETISDELIENLKSAYYTCAHNKKALETIFPEVDLQWVGGKKSGSL